MHADAAPHAVLEAIARRNRAVVTRPTLVARALPANAPAMLQAATNAQLRSAVEARPASRAHARAVGASPLWCGTQRVATTPFALRAFPPRLALTRGATAHAVHTAIARGHRAVLTLPAIVARARATHARTMARAAIRACEQLARLARVPLIARAAAAVAQPVTRARCVARAVARQIFRAVGAAPALIALALAVRAVATAVAGAIVWAEWRGQPAVEPLPSVLAHAAALEA